MKDCKQLAEVQRYQSDTHAKGRGKPLTGPQKDADRTKSKVCARVKYIFGAQADVGGHLVGTLGLQRAKVKIGLVNLVYNMIRLVQLIKLDVKASKQTLLDKHREGAAIMA